MSLASYIGIGGLSTLFTQRPMTTRTTHSIVRRTAKDVSEQLSAVGRSMTENLAKKAPSKLYDENAHYKKLSDKLGANSNPALKELVNRAGNGNDAFSRNFLKKATAAVPKARIEGMGQLHIDEPVIEAPLTAEQEEALAIADARKKTAEKVAALKARAKASAAARAAEATAAPAAAAPATDAKAARAAKAAQTKEAKRLAAAAPAAAAPVVAAAAEQTKEAKRLAREAKAAEKLAEKAAAKAAARAPNSAEAKEARKVAKAEKKLAKAAAKAADRTAAKAVAAAKVAAAAPPAAAPVAAPEPAAAEAAPEPAAAAPPADGMTGAERVVADDLEENSFQTNNDSSVILATAEANPLLAGLEMTVNPDTDKVEIFVASRAEVKELKEALSKQIVSLVNHKKYKAILSKLVQNIKVSKTAPAAAVGGGGSAAAAAAPTSATGAIKGALAADKKQ